MSVSIEQGKSSMERDSSASERQPISGTALELGCFRERTFSENDHTAGAAAQHAANAVRRKHSAAQPTTWKEIPQLVWKDEIHNSFHVGADIGGSLCKLTFYEAANCPKHLDTLKDFIKSSTTYGTSGIRDPNLSFAHAGGQFHFLHFQTRRMEGAFNLLKENKLPVPKRFPATGGGAFKFSGQFEAELGVQLDKRDEMLCLLLGLNFLLQTVEDECYHLDLSENPDPMLSLNTKKLPYNMKQEHPFPYLLVNIGSGVSILRVDSESEFERVGGTCIGGGTYWGLLKLLTQCETFEEAMAMASKGNFQKVNMLVSDIYGGDYEEFGLKSTTVASAFGKLVMSDRTREDYNQNDLAAALLHMIGANIAQVAYLTGLRHNVNRILFAGNFLRHNPVSASFLASSIHYWSKGKMRAIFLKHEGYFGSLGALLTQESHAPQGVRCERSGDDDEEEIDGWCVSGTPSTPSTGHSDRDSSTIQRKTSRNQKRQRSQRGKKTGKQRSNKSVDNGSDPCKEGQFEERSDKDLVWRGCEVTSKFVVFCALLLGWVLYLTNYVPLVIPTTK